MSGRYLTDLADVLRRAGLIVIEVDGWQGRARGSGGYSSGRPTHVMVHHTASGASSDGWPDVNYCTFGSENAPVCNLYLDRSGLVYVCAAGATNTNGSGGPLDNVPADSMNTHAIGIEAGNNGVGEPWPAAQQRAYTQMCGALMAHYDLAYVRAHVEWAPGRKVDPAGPSEWAPGGGTWNMDAFRQDLTTTPPPIPIPEEDMTDEQAAQLAQVHAILAKNYEPQISDPWGVPMNMQWTTAWGYLRTNDVLTVLNQILDAVSPGAQMAAEIAPPGPTTASAEAPKGA